MLIAKCDNCRREIRNRDKRIVAGLGWDSKELCFEGELIKKLRKEDEKVNRLADMLKEKKVLSESDITELQRLQVFPK